MRMRKVTPDSISGLLCLYMTGIHIDRISKNSFLHYLTLIIGSQQNFWVSETQKYLNNCDFELNHPLDGKKLFANESLNVYKYYVMTDFNFV